MKRCSYCNVPINEEDNNLRWGMIISKKGKKITAFEYFHKGCYKRLFDRSVRIAMEEGQWTNFQKPL